MVPILLVGYHSTIDIKFSESNLIVTCPKVLDTLCFHIIIYPWNSCQELTGKLCVNYFKEMNDQSQKFNTIKHSILHKKKNMVKKCIVCSNVTLFTLIYLTDLY